MMNKNCNKLKTITNKMAKTKKNVKAAIKTEK